MPPTTRAAARARNAAAAAALPPHLLARVLSFLPPGDAILTVPRLSKALAAEWAPRVAELREEAAAARARVGPNRFVALETFSIPLWALQEAWPQLEQRQRVRAAERAAFHGDLDAMRWSLLRRRDYFVAYCAAAAAGGQLEALQCVRVRGCAWQLKVPNWDVSTSVAAASGGHLAVLQWGRAQRPPCPWDGETCQEAASGGHLAVLQWARAQQPPCPWNEWTCITAACGGHLAVLQWARAQQPPCPWDVAQCFYAASDRAVFDWVQANAYEDEAL